MKRRHVFLMSLVCFSFLVMLIGTAGATQELTNEEWKQILAIGDEKLPLTGAQISFMTDPSYYYMTSGEPLFLSGTIKDVFGPLSNTNLTVERRNETGFLISYPVTTDEMGRFFLTDLPEEVGAYQYLVNLSFFDKNLTSPVLSDTLEVKYRLSEDDNEPLNTDSVHSIDNAIDENQSYQLSLSSTGSSFVPGTPILLSGSLLKEGRPIRYERMELHLNSFEGNISSGGILEGFSKPAGNVSFIFSPTGPYPIFCTLEYPGKDKENSSWSDSLTFIPDNPGINPPARIVRDDESIDLYTDNETVHSLDNVILYGWYGKKGGETGSFQSLDCVWYNVGTKTWDLYQNSTMMVTNADGAFEYSLQAPQTPGLYVLGVRREGNTTTKPLYSNIKPILVKKPEDVQKSTSDFSQPILSLSSASSYGRVSEPVNLMISCVYPDDTPVVHLPVALMVSKNGIDWNDLYEVPQPTGEDGLAEISIYPDTSGYLYFRAIAGESAEDIISSSILNIPILSDSEEIPVQ